jgi:ABC-type Fe3+ transport system substrate-binding protein
MRHAAFLVLATVLASMLACAHALAPAHAAEPYRPDPGLLAAAQKEGQVLLYTTHIVDQIVRPMIRGFGAVAPGIDVKYVRADGMPLVVRLINEARAGRVQADVWSMVEGVGPVLQGGHGATFDIPSAKGLPPTLADPNKRWIALNLSIRSMAFNTSLVPPAQAPRSFKDLLDPKWKDKMVWNPKSMTGAWGFIATVMNSMGEQEGLAYLRALAKQDIVPLPIAIRAVLDRVIAGEYAIGLEMNNSHAAISAAAGAPVKWVPLDPVTETLQVAGISTDAPHPNAAKLFVDFMASRAGQEILREHDYLPMHPDVPAKIPELKPEQGGFKAVIYGPNEIDAENDRWNKIYQDIFR